MHNFNHSSVCAYRHVSDEASDVVGDTVKASTTILEAIPWILVATCTSKYPLCSLDARTLFNGSRGR